jgi:hypothetical protein
MAQCGIFYRNIKKNKDIKPQIQTRDQKTRKKNVFLCAFVAIPPSVAVLVTNVVSSFFLVFDFLFYCVFTNLQTSWLFLNVVVSCSLCASLIAMRSQSSFFLFGF